MGEPPAVEITMTNLNDNIDKLFMNNLIHKCGVVSELYIYYHPTTNKHLGLGRIVFEAVKSAKMCIEKYNGTSVMGKVILGIVDNYIESILKGFLSFFLRF